ncbi:MAG: hypothetical protein E7460_00200 [Ruminococcaceae bacterium]|nr:hypothetical protein [Oscillospiraceae bacterium]
MNRTNDFRIEWHSLLRDILKNLWVVVLSAISALILVWVAGKSVYRPVYTSSATLIVTAKSGTYLAYTNLSASSEMAEIFSEVFSQPTMREYAAEHLGRGWFDGSVSASVIPNTNILTLSVTASSPQTAYEELCAVLEVYPRISETIFADAIIDVMRSPTVPKGPSNAISTQNRFIFAGAAALAALAAVVVISVARDTVKDEHDFNEKVGEKLVGTVAHTRKKLPLSAALKGKKTSLLINSAYSDFRFTESYQKIANRLSYAHRRSGDSVFLITSVAENEGKSTAAANIALALASRGNRVALLDMDFLKPALYKILGVSVSAQSDFAALLSGSTSLESFKIRRYRNTSLYLALNARHRRDYTGWINSERVPQTLELFRNKFDYVIIDTPPMIFSADVASLCRHADRSLLVVRTDKALTADINDAVLKLTSSGEKFGGCILNDVYSEFTFFGQTGADESGYSGYGYGSHYSKKGKYEAFTPSSAQGSGSDGDGNK